MMSSFCPDPQENKDDGITTENCTQQKGYTERPWPLKSLNLPLKQQLRFDMKSDGGAHVNNSALMCLFLLFCPAFPPPKTEVCQKTKKLQWLYSQCWHCRTLQEYYRSILNIMRTGKRCAGKLFYSNEKPEKKYETSPITRQTEDNKTLFSAALSSRFKHEVNESLQQFVNTWIESNILPAAASVFTIKRQQQVPSGGLNPE